MGPTSTLLLQEMMAKIDLAKDKRILDLGCGRGLTSIYLAEKTQAQIFALDLWISATENYERFKEVKLENQIIPVHADITEVPFANDYFDSMVSIDAYHYFGRAPDFMDTKIAPLVKKGGFIALAFPGLKTEFGADIPQEMLFSWGVEDIQTWHSISWWQSLLAQSSMVEIMDIQEMKCFDQAWEEWLGCDNEYAQNDCKAMHAGAGKYMNFISIICKRK